MDAPAPISGHCPHNDDYVAEFDTLARFIEPLLVEDITTDVVIERLSYRLSRLIGPGKRFSLAEAAETTGIDQRTLHSYLSGAACPTLAKYYRLERLIGPELGVELARMLGWEPRHSASPPVPTRDLVAVLRALNLAQERISELLDAQDGLSVLRSTAPGGGAPARPRAGSGGGTPEH